MTGDGENQPSGATTDLRQHRPVLAMLLMCLAVGLLILLELAAKAAATNGVPVLEVVWVRYSVHLVIFAAVFAPRMGLRLVKTKRLGIQILRSALLLWMTIASFLSLKYLQMAEVTVIGFASPFLVALLSMPLLGERVGPHRWAAIIVGFIGVLIVIRPGSTDMHWAMLVIFAGVVGYAFYLILTRKIADTENAVTSVFYTALLGALIMSLPMPWVWETPDDAVTWGFLLSTGLFGGLAHFVIIIAHRYAAASLLAPFYYTQIVWSVLAGFLMFGDIPDQYTFLGAAVVISGGLYLMAREARARNRSKT